MPTAPAQRCANVANENKWTYDENRVLLGAIEQFSNGKIIWDVVGKVMKAKPWSRQTHKYFPAAARARAVELWPWGFRFSRQFNREEQAMYDVWMNFVMPHEVTRDYGRFGPSPFDNPEFQVLLRSAVTAHRVGDRDGAGRAAAAIAAAAAAASAALA